jgi:hypothetical protein
MILGIIGGFAGLVWSLLNLCIGSCQTFRLETHLLKSFYSADSCIKENNIEPNDRVEKDITAELKDRTNYVYSYWSYFLACSLKKGCCCCRRYKCCRQHEKRYDFHAENVERMNSELDIVGLV